MFRKFISLILMLCVAWQALVFAGADVLLADEREQLHELLHFQGILHHHDEHHQGGVHLDDSPASDTHLLVETGVFGAGLMPSTGCLFTSLVQGGLPSHTAPSWPMAYLDGLERPPRLTA